MYVTGRGVFQDIQKAYMWFNILVANGNDFAREIRDKVASLMTPSQIAKAQEMASACINSNYQEC